MYILFILFFISLFGIVFMIGRKLTFLKNGELLNNLSSEEEVLFEIPHLGKIKHYTFENIKKYGHLALIGALRFYVRCSNFLKNKYEEGKTKIENKSQQGLNAGQRETSKFLNKISDYKNKISKIKQKIHEEEKDL